MFPNIRVEMARHKRKKAEMAAILGISENSFRFKMDGKREFTLNELRVLAEHFGVTIDYLVVPENCAEADQ